MSSRAGTAQRGQGVLGEAFQHAARGAVDLAAERQDKLVDADGTIALHELAEGVDRGPGVVLGEADEQRAPNLPRVAAEGGTVRVEALGTLPSHGQRLV